MPETLSARNQHILDAIKSYHTLSGHIAERGGLEHKTSRRERRIIGGSHEKIYKNLSAANATLANLDPFGERYEQGFLHEIRQIITRFSPIEVAFSDFTTLPIAKQLIERQLADQTTSTQPLSDLPSPPQQPGRAQILIDLDAKGRLMLRRKNRKQNAGISIEGLHPGDKLQLRRVTHNLSLR